MIGYIILAGDVYVSVSLHMFAYCKYLLNRFGDVYHPLELCDCLIYIMDQASPN